MMKFEKLGQITKNLDSRRIPLNSEERIAKSNKGLYPYIGANNIVGYIDEYIFDEKILCVAEDGGSWGANQQCAVIYEGKTWVNNHAHVLIENGKANLEYVKNYLNYANLNKYIKGTTRGKLNKSVLENIPIPLPSFSDQLHIANLLSKAENLIAQRKESIRLLDEFLKSTFLEMFGDPASNKNGWETFTIREVALRFSDGPFGSNLKTEHYSNSGIQVIRLQNIGINEFVEKDITYVQTNHYENVLKKYSCVPGDVVIATMGEPNIRACIVPKHVNVAVNKADCVLSRVNPKLSNPYYISHLLNLEGFLFLANSFIHGQTRARISSGQIAKISIPIPPLELQTQFAQIVEKTEALKTQYQQSLQELENLYGSLSQRAFRGELGLKDNGLLMAAELEVKYKKNR